MSRNVVYNITLKIEPEIVHIWLRWTSTFLFPQLKEGFGITDVHLFEVFEQDLSFENTFSLQCTFKTLDLFHQNSKTFQDLFYSSHDQYFPGKYVAFGTLLRVKSF